MWEIKRNSLLPQLDVLSMVPSKLAVPSSQYFRVSGKDNTIKISAASYIGGEIKLTGKGTWPFEEDFFLDRLLFVPFCTAARELKDKHTFKFEKHGKQLLVRHGSRKVTFDSQPDIKGYGNIHRILKHIDNTIPISSDLKDMLICGKSCAVSDAIAPHINCVYLEKGTSGVRVKLYATSDKVIYLGTGKLTEGKITASIPFPLFLISLLEVEGLKKIMCAGKYIVLKFEHGIVWQPISQEAVKDFPLRKIRSHVKIGKSKKITFITSSRSFSRLMIRLGYYLQSAKRKDWVVFIKGKKGSQIIDIYTSISGAKFSERISTSDALSKDFKIEWPLNLVEQVFGYLSKKTKKLGLIVRVDDRHKVSYVTVGRYWLAITGKQE